MRNKRIIIERFEEERKKLFSRLFIALGLLALFDVFSACSLQLKWENYFKHMLTIFPTIFQFLFCLLATWTNVLRCVSSDPKLRLISGFEKNPLRPAGSSSFHTHTAHTEHWWISKLN